MEMEINMTDRDQLVKQLQEQIILTGSQVKQRMKLVQMELLEELKDEHGNGIDLR
jgi:hypothetical protein